MRQALNRGQRAAIDQRLCRPHREIARPARRQNRVYADGAKFERQPGHPAIGEGERVIHLEFAPPIYKNIIENRRPALAAGGHHDQLFIEEMLDDEAGPVDRPVHDRQIQRSLDQPVHQADG
jgi:hypothetical protein